MPDSKKSLTEGQGPGAKAGTKRPLTPKQELFCHYYLLLKNGTRAYMQAGYEGDEGVAASEAHRLLRNPKIQARLRAMGMPVLQAMGWDRERVLEELAVMASADVGALFEIKNGKPQLKKNVPRSALRGMTGLSYSEGQHGDSISFKMDKLGALERIGQYVGVFDKGNGDDQGDGSTPDEGVLESLSAAVAEGEEG